MSNFTKKYWKSLLSQFVRQKFYSIFHGIVFDSKLKRGTTLPFVGENVFVKIQRRGDYLEIESKKKDAMIRMIPSTHSLGYVVECHKDGEIISRGQVSFNDLWKFINVK